MSASFLALPLLWPLLMAATLLMLQGRLYAWQTRLHVFGSGVHFLLCSWLWTIVWSDGTHVLRFGDWPAPYGIVFVADLLGATMVLATGFIGFCIAVYVSASPGSRRTGYFAATQTLIMGVIGAFLTGDLFNLFVWFEVMLMSSFALMVFEGKRSQLEGALKYLALNFIASMLFLSATGLIYGATGTLNFADLALRLPAVSEPILTRSALALLLIAFGTKAGVFPLFFWLPASYHTPKVATTALFGALLTKVGVYALVRVLTLVFPESLVWLKPILLTVASLTMVTGVLGAVAHFEVRRILSFHIISQIGYMIMALALFTTQSMGAAIFFVLHNMLAKTCLFLVGGVMLHLRGTAELKKLGGLFKEQPLLSVLFLVSALSLSGLPPFTGFFAKLWVIRSGIETGDYWISGVALAVGVLTLYSMTKIWNEAFLKKQRLSTSDVAWQIGTGKIQKTEAIPLAYLAPMVAMVLLMFVFGLFPQMFMKPMERIGAEIMKPRAYIEAVLGGEGKKR